MCGICGVVQIGAGELRDVVATDVLDHMTDTMTHRGPNDRGTYQARGVALGVRRLSIIDVGGGHQPIADDSGLIWGVQNGELYNHLQVRDELAATGVVFKTRCDTEVIPYLYRRDGDLFPRALRGMFATAVWDERRRRAVLARDRLGIKPLYYAQAGDLLIFASELKSLLASGLVGVALDLEAIDAYLSFGFVPGPRTPLLGVSKLMPGHVLVADERGIRAERYWEHPQPPADKDGRRAEGDWQVELLEHLEEAVRLRLMSDVPLGAMLSGGLDSSLIVAVMARNMSEPVKTFSVGFRESPDSNELADARHVSEVFGTEHHELELSFLEDTVDLETLSWYMDEPLADLSALGFLALSELASRHVAVALSGQGADELLGGYRKHRAAMLLERLRPVRLPLAVAGRAAGHWSPTLARSAATFAASTPAERLLAMSGRIDEDQRGRLVRPGSSLDGRAAARTVEALAVGLDSDVLAETLYLDAQLALVDDMLHYFDRASMAHSLEVRVPFLDHRFVEFCASIPSGLKVRGLTTKYILKEAARGILPDRIIDKPKTGFFRGAVSAWFQAQAGRAIDAYLLASEPRCAEFLDTGEIARLVARHRESGDADLGHLLLALLMLEVWLSTYLPRVSRQAAVAVV